MGSEFRHFNQQSAARARDVCVCENKVPDRLSSSSYERYNCRIIITNKGFIVIEYFIINKVKDYKKQ